MEREKGLNLAGMLNVGFLDANRDGFRVSPVKVSRLMTLKFESPLLTIESWVGQLHFQKEIDESTSPAWLVAAIDHDRRCPESHAITHSAAAQAG